MDCQEIIQLERAQSMHREAALFLSCGEAIASAKAISSHGALLRTCRADQARTTQAILRHRRHCLSCIPRQ